MAATAVSKPQLSSTAQLLHGCQGLSVWKGRRRFDARKIFPLPFPGSGWGSLLFIPAKRNRSGILERQSDVWTGCARILRCGTASWNTGAAHPGDKELHRGKNHVCRLSQGNRRFGTHKGLQKKENIQGAEEENYLQAKRRVGCSPKPKSCSETRQRDKPSLPTVPITQTSKLRGRNTSWSASSSDSFLMNAASEEVNRVQSEHFDTGRRVTPLL